MKVTLPYDPEWPALKWAKENCPSYYTNTATQVDSVYGYNVHYYFTEEKDVVAFTLKWL